MAGEWRVEGEEDESEPGDGCFAILRRPSSIIEGPSAGLVQCRNYRQTCSVTPATGHALPRLARRTMRLFLAASTRPISRPRSPRRAVIRTLSHDPSPKHQPRSPGPHIPSPPTQPEPQDHRRSWFFTANKISNFVVIPGAFWASVLRRDIALDIVFVSRHLV